MSLDWIDAELRKLSESHLLRSRVSRAGKLGPQIVIDGKRYIGFASNDYLGIASDSALQEIVERTVRSSGWGSGASPLIIGRSALHAELERRLATFFGKEAALLFPTGFAANTGTIPAMVSKHDVIFSDAKNHASIIDGCRLSGARIEVYPHRDVVALQRLIAENDRDGRQLIVTDSVFSMDGDKAPIAEIASVARAHNAMLMVDEAHAVGVIGPDGRGVSAEANVMESVDVLVGTLSKSFGSHGGFVVGSRKLIDFLTNRARSYVFSTAGPVAAAAVALAALTIMRDQPERRNRLISISGQLRTRLADQGWNIGSSESHIIPIVVGECAETITLSAHLKDRGYWVPCIRPPSVPSGESLLRVSLSSAHTDEMVDGLVEAIADFAGFQPVH